MRGFEAITAQPEAILPKRSDAGSAGYDFFTQDRISVAPGEKIRIETGVKAYMQSGEVLQVFIRSSLGNTTKDDKALRIANGTGIIDSSYYNNPANEGEICVYLVNEGRHTVTLEKGERFAQGIFLAYLLTQDDLAPSVERSGGSGSSGRF